MDKIFSLRVPGSKSITNRALLIAALAKGKTTLKNFLESADTRHMRQALKKLGVKIAQRGNTLLVQGGLLYRSASKIFCGNSGTAMRFLTAVLAAQPFETILDGDQRMRERPIGDLLDSLRQLGAHAYSLKRNGYPPIFVKGPLKGGKCLIKGNISSQFLSGLLIAAPLAQNEVTILGEGDLVSKPYVDMTCDLIKRFGVLVERNGYKKFFIKEGQNYKARIFEIEGDASSASYFWGISALTGEPIHVTNIPKKSPQPDMELKEMLTCDMASFLDPINYQNFPDSAMTYAVLSAFQKEKSELRGLSNLRIKECDRLHALAVELRRIGCHVKELPDGLKISGNPEKLHGARIKTYNDHRMAMCFGMASFVLPGIKIENPGCVKKTYPNFWKDLRKLKKKFLEKNIILTGMRGTGKTELGKALAQSLQRKFIDIDELIECTAKKTISEIVQTKGWKYFRNLERKIVKKLRFVKHAVIATGGGTLINQQNAKILQENGKIIFLDAKIGILKKRLQHYKNRPSLTGENNFLNELSQVYKKRKKQYLDIADAITNVSAHTKNAKNDIREKIEKLKKVVARLGMV